MICLNLYILKNIKAVRNEKREDFDIFKARTPIFMIPLMLRPTPMVDFPRENDHPCPIWRDLWEAGFGSWGFPEE